MWVIEYYLLDMGTSDRAAKRIFYTYYITCYVSIDRTFFEGKICTVHFTVDEF